MDFIACDYKLHIQLSKNTINHLLSASFALQEEGIKNYMIKYHIPVHICLFDIFLLFFCLMNCLFVDLCRINRSVSRLRMNICGISCRIIELNLQF